MKQKIGNFFNKKQNVVVVVVLLLILFVGIPLIRKVLFALKLKLKGIENSNEVEPGEEGETVDLVEAARKIYNLLHAKDVFNLTLKTRSALVVGILKIVTAQYIPQLAQKYAYHGQDLYTDLQNKLANESYNEIAPML